MTSSASQSQREIVLVAIEGEVDPGTEYAVPLDRPLEIGRSARGLKIHDTLVSIHHARISYHPRRGYVIEDLGSATGTWVDEEVIRGSSRPIGVGTILRFGSTVFEVAPSNRIQPWMRAVAAVSAGMLLFALLVFVGMSLATPKGESPVLATPRHQTIECKSDQRRHVAVPEAFRRHRGISITDLQVEQVRDDDGNDCSEIWLRIKNEYTVVVTFGESLDDWVILGEFPSLCSPPTPTFDGKRDYLPIVRCDGTEWFIPAEGDRYELSRHDGVVVFYRPVAKPFIPVPDGRPGKKKKNKKKVKHETAPASDAPVKFQNRIAAGRFTLPDEATFSQFLVERGISSRVHYLLCEKAFPNEVEAQVLLEHEAVQQLGKGCQHQLRLEEGDGSVYGEPVAVAFTEWGRRALADDLFTFFGGDPEGLFLGNQRRATLERFRANPGKPRPIHLIGDTDEMKPPVAIFDFLASSPIEKPSHQLIEHFQYARGAAPYVRTHTLPKKQKYLVNTPGCAELVVQVNDFTSEGWESMIPFTFLEVSDRGCNNGKSQRLFRANYSALGWLVRDARPNQVGGLNVRAVLETTSTGRGIEVLRARLAIRDPNNRPPRLNVLDERELGDVSPD